MLGQSCRGFPLRGPGSSLPRMPAVRRWCQSNSSRTAGRSWSPASEFDTWRTKWRGPWGCPKEEEPAGRSTIEFPHYTFLYAKFLNHLEPFLTAWLGYPWGPCYIVPILLNLTMFLWTFVLSASGQMLMDGFGSANWFSPPDWFSGVPFLASLCSLWKEKHQQSGRAWSTKTGNVLGATARSLCFICCPGWIRDLHLGSCSEEGSIWDRYHWEGDIRWHVFSHICRVWSRVEGLCPWYGAVSGDWDRPNTEKVRELASNSLTEKHRYFIRLVQGDVRDRCLESQNRSQLIFDTGTQMNKVS